MHLPTDIRTLLTSLGWSDEHLDITNDYTHHYSKSEPSLYIRGCGKRGHGYGIHLNRIVMGFNHKDAKYGDAIASKTIDVTTKNCARQIIAWHTRTTFALADLRTKHSERDQRSARYQARRKDHGEELAAILGSVAAGYVSPNGYADDGSYTQMQVHYTLAGALNLHLKGPVTLEDAARRGKLLIEVLRRHNFLP